MILYFSFAEQVVYTQSFHGAAVLDTFATWCTPGDSISSVQKPENGDKNGNGNGNTDTTPVTKTYYWVIILIIFLIIGIVGCFVVYKYRKKVV
jgi:hypothetical protein